MADKYIIDRSLLKSQPKKVIAEYVRQNGFLVPRVFDSLHEAKSSGLQVICRTEHEQDYDGVSGLLKTVDLSRMPDANDLSTLVSKFFDLNSTCYPYDWSRRTRLYCDMLGIDINEFIKDVSLSLWEKIPGVNRMVVADSAVEGRYHITGISSKTDSAYEYIILDTVGKENVEFIAAKDMKTDKENLFSLVRMYEGIRNLDNFDPLHCPIMEFQSSGYDHFFLQYYRCRDFAGAEFLLDRPKESGEQDAFFVRGATPYGGKVFKTTIFLGDQLSDKPVWSLDMSGDGLFSSYFRHVFFELVIKKTSFFMMSNVNEVRLEEPDSSHSFATKLFKPGVSLITDHSKLLPADEFESKLFRSLETGEDQHIYVKVTSDGRKAYVKRV